MRYIGRREHLIAAGVATDEMFPPRGGKRKFARAISCHVPDWFSVTRRGTRFLVTRWAYWNDPANQARMLEEEPERHAHLRPEQPVTPTSTKLAPAKEASRTAHLSDDAIAIAEGWSILPPRMKAHVQCVINDHIARECPALAKLYEAGRMDGQIRWKWKELDLYAKAQGRTAGAADDDDDGDEDA